MTMRRWFVAVTLAVAALVANSGLANAAEPALPSRMAAIGDSITRANDVCCWYGDHPGNSWSTGSASGDGVASHYERIRALKPTAVAYNDAGSGARMSDAPGQATRAVGQGARYVTVLMGANDLCTSSTATMTSVDTFRSAVPADADDAELRPATSARIFVASIPDVYHLWELYRCDLVAQSVWAVAGICQSLLSLSEHRHAAAASSGTATSPSTRCWRRSAPSTPTAGSMATPSSTTRSAKPGQQAGLLPPQPVRPGRTGGCYMAGFLVGRLRPPPKAR